MTDRDNANDQRRGSTAAVWFVAVVTLLPALYVLSLGPAVRLFDHNGSPFQPFVAALYSPLEWLANNCKTIGDALSFYVSLWMP
jgi:hypothetical protein